MFVGDLDPLDLLVYAAWRNGPSKLRGKAGIGMPVAYGGIRDSWATRLDRRLQMEMGPFERELWPYVRRILPDVHELVGPKCFALLQAGRKIELEGATNPHIHGPGRVARILRDLRRIGRSTATLRVASRERT